jgi:hypothetical protein
LANALLLLKDAMARQHKFLVGESVYFIPDLIMEPSARGTYTIIRGLPDAAGVPQYRIRSAANGQERVVREDQLDRSAP